MSKVPYQAIIDVRMTCDIHERNHRGQIAGTAIHSEEQFGKLFTIQADNLDDIKEQASALFQQLMENIEKCHVSRQKK